MLSWIQYHILVELTRHSLRRYSQLRPRDVEGNLFMYHLKGLMADGLVEKADGQYQLTLKGLQFVGTLSLKTGRTRKQPKILNAIICRNKAGEYLITRWRRQPNAELVSFPHGMMHYGEPVMEMAAHELAEKAGLQAQLQYRGDVYVRGKLAGMLDRHMLVHLFEATKPEPADGAGASEEIGESFWAALDTLRPEEFVPGFYEIAKLADENPTGTIFADIEIEVGAPASD
ncbi:MAG TPA: NUDIX domain-containing protein [Candidatus Saccharimonadales bacterium]|nr:NUDIX domain-containing protein [Candidatus Saccharimonadales bacterium]